MLRNSSSLMRSLASVGGGAWAATQSVPQPDNMIDLTVADPDLPSPKAVVARAVAALQAGDTRYTETAGRSHVRRAIAQRHEQWSGQRVSTENVLLAPGAQGALYLAARCLAGPGDHILVIEPHYVNYPATLAATGAEVDYLRTDPDLDFRLTEAMIAAAVKPKTKAIVLANPNNPSGSMLRQDEILALAAVAMRRDLWLVCDEIYRELCYEEGFASLASCGLVDDRLVSLGSLSKSHAMTGWRLGWMIAPQPLIAQATSLADVVYHGLPGFIQEAAMPALADYGAAARNAVEVYRHRRDIFASRLGSSAAILPRTPQAGPFMLCDVRGTGLSGAQFAEAAWAEAGVALLDGGRFGRSSAGCVRVALTSPEEALTEAAHRLAHLSRRFSGNRPGSRGQAVPDAPPAADCPAFADGIYISSSGAVHVWRDGNLEGVF